MTVLLWLDASVVLACVLYCAALPFKIHRLPRVGAGRSPAGRARVSVIVPARNEEKLLPKCLDSIRAQERAVDEIIVVDDESHDATARCAIEHGACVIFPGPRPPGWTGKPWAAHAGANVATGDWLLFVDADAALGPRCVGAALAEAEAQRTDLLSLIPAWRSSTLLEALVQPIFFMVLSGFFNFDKMNDPANPIATAWGGFLLFRRDAYDKIGGHTAVKNVIVEDLAIAREVKQRGMKLRVLPGPELAETARPLTARRIWDDAHRAACGFSRGSALLALLSAAMLFANFVGPYVLAPLGPRFAVLAGVHYMGAILARVQAGRMGFDYRLALLQPVGALYLVAAMLWASIATFTGHAVVRWGARQYKG